MSSSILQEGGNDLGKIDDELLDEDDKKEKKTFDFENFLSINRVPVALLLVGLILIGFGVMLFQKGYIGNSDKVEVLEVDSDGEGMGGEIVVEIAGAIEKPGVYKFENNARVEDLLVSAGGLSVDASREWVEKFINRAAKLVDGQKLYIPSSDESSNSTGKQSDATSANFLEGEEGVLGSQGELININTATQKQLESLWGIGPVYAQNIIEHRPYSDVRELLTKKILKTNVYERNRNKLTVY